jgi:hypothetical protein
MVTHFESIPVTYRNAELARRNDELEGCRMRMICSWDRYKL